MPVSDHLSQLRDELRSCSGLKQTAQDTLNGEAKSIVYEGLLLRAFRAYENYIERVFVSYLAGETTTGGTKVKSFVSPSDEKHARQMIFPDAARFLDWSDPSTVQSRCSIFFERDDPVGTAILSRSQDLLWMKKIRNHIAHNSKESKKQFEGVLGAILLTVPNPIPSAGEFLAEIPNRGRLKQREVLSYFLEVVSDFGEAAAKDSRSDYE